ncbi:MAG: hypothetical protein ACRDQA_06820 [Nocardioidaceae bacterium]
MIRSPAREVDERAARAACTFAGSLRRFLTENVEPGSTVLTDGWRSYPPAIGQDYRHEQLIVRPTPRCAGDLGNRACTQSLSKASPMPTKPSCASK